MILILLFQMHFLFSEGKMAGSLLTCTSSASCQGSFQIKERRWVGKDNNL